MGMGRHMRNGMPPCPREGVPLFPLFFPEIYSGETWFAAEILGWENLRQK
jgi:hypothetical protein